MAKVTIKDWDPGFVQRRTQEFLFEFGPIIAFQVQQEIKIKQFEWPTSTVRKNGQVVEKGKRDIVDTGLLLNSQTRPMVKATATGAELSITWPAKNPKTGQYYSQAVLEGGYLIGTLRTSYIAPARDWITPAFEKTNPLGYMQRRFDLLRNVRYTK